jgi:peptidoglycan hydrolase FlgJ
VAQNQESFQEQEKSAMTLISATNPLPPAGKADLPLPPDRDAQLLNAAKQLEAGFIAEMLKSAGLGKSRQSFGGGAGEEGFASFLLRAQADKIVQAGGFGLARKIYEDLKAREAGNG